MSVEKPLFVSAFASTKDLLQGIRESGERGEKSEIFIIGGGQIYEQAIKIADKLYLTIVDDPPTGGFDADTFFPDYAQFKKVVFEQNRESDKYRYKFLELEK